MSFKGPKGFTTFESLRFYDFRWLWLGSLASFMALNMQMITRGWLVLRLSEDSPFALSLVMMAIAFPMIIMSPIAGAIADRISRKHIVMFSQGGNACMTLILATLDLTGQIQFWHLLVIGLVNGSLFAFNMPSRQTLISDIVPADMLMNAVSLNNSGMNLSRIIGPALAGILIIYLKTSGVFYLIAGFYICSALSMMAVRTKGESTVRTQKGIFTDIREGFSYASGDKTIAGLIIIFLVPALFGFPCIALLPAWAREALNVQSDSLGMLMMVMGIGALAGSLILASFGNTGKRGTFLLIVGFGWGLFLMMFSQSSSYSSAIPLLLMVGFMNALFMSLNMTLIQAYADEEMRGRIMSISMMTFGAMPLSIVPFGAMAEKVGTPAALGLSGLALLVFMAVFTIKNPEFRKIG